MSDKSAFLAIDQGTTSSRAIVFDLNATIISQSQEEFAQIYPKPGWVEHNPEQIWQTSLQTAQQAFAQAEQAGYHVKAIGITNQRETSLAWHTQTGETSGNAIVWQDRRTADFCQQLKEQDLESSIQQKTGLLLDPYFSASKFNWLLQNNKTVQQWADQKQLALGTVDSFLIAKLTGNYQPVTDATNASRTSLFNIHSQDWDDNLLALFDIPRWALATVKDSIADFGHTDSQWFGRSIPICAVLGDQQAASVGQGCFKRGEMKCTFGTGGFALVNTGEQCLTSSNQLLSTIAYRLDGKVSYALEGAIFNAGTTVQWLRDELGLIKSASETESLASSISSTDGVYLVPAFTGMGAPYWRADAKAAVVGLNRNSGKKQIVRAALEAVSYQTYDLLIAMQADGIECSKLKVDGGMVANDWLMQNLADICQTPVIKPKVNETTALGAAFFAAMGAGLFESTQQILDAWQVEAEFRPQMPSSQQQTLLQGWHQAVSRVLD